VLKKKYILFILVTFAFIPCNAQNGKSKRYFYKFIYSIFSEKEVKSYNRNTKNTKGSNSFSSSKRKVVNKNSVFKSDKKEKSYNRKFRIFSSSSKYSSKNRKVQNKTFFFGPDIKISAFNRKVKAFIPTSKYNSKHRKVESNESFFSFRPKGLCERKDSYSREWHGGASAFTFSRKLRKVVKKRLLGIFTINKREGENLSFHGADYKNNKFYVYKKKEKRIKHPRNIFGKHRKETENKHKKPQMRLFPKSMYDFTE
jgi:hypothetical protein